MPRYCANLSMLFRELPLIERIGAARKAGFEAVEILFPYDDPAHLIARELERSAMPLLLINTPPPNWTGGDRGFAAVPGREDRFRHDFRRTMRFAAVLKPRFIHVMAGVADGPAARDTFLRNLAWAAAEVPFQDLTIEPLNPVDMPGYFLDDFALAADILAELHAPNLGLQFDSYHAQKITGDVPGTWERVGDRVVHVQVADPDGRHEPTDAVVDHSAFFARLDADGYAGHVSAEYTPRGRTCDGLGWMI